MGCTSGIKVTTVMGTTYEVWSDFIKRGTIAKNIETGETFQISWHGYVSNDLSVRKAIASAKLLDSFRK